MGFCTLCGTRQPEGGHYCFKCGTSLVVCGPPSSSSSSDRVANNSSPPPPQPAPPDQQRLSPARERRQSSAAGRSSVRIVKNSFEVVPPFAVGGCMEQSDESSNAGARYKRLATLADSPPATQQHHRTRTSSLPRRRGRAFVESRHQEEAARELIFPDTLPQGSTPPRLRQLRDDRERRRRGYYEGDGGFEGGRSPVRVRIKKKQPALRNGLVLDEDNLVLEVLPGGPADLAGVVAGMRLLEVDGIRVHSSDEALSLMRQQKNFSVLLLPPPLPSPPAPPPPPLRPPSPARQPSPPAAAAEGATPPSPPFLTPSKQNPTARLVSRRHHEKQRLLQDLHNRQRMENDGPAVPSPGSPPPPSPPPYGSSAAGTVSPRAGMKANAGFFKQGVEGIEVFGSTPREREWDPPYRPPSPSVPDASRFINGPVLEEPAAEGYRAPPPPPPPPVSQPTPSRSTQASDAAREKYRMRLEKYQEPVHVPHVRPRPGDDMSAADSFEDDSLALVPNERLLSTSETWPTDPTMRAKTFKPQISCACNTSPFSLSRSYNCTYCNASCCMDCYWTGKCLHCRDSAAVPQFKYTDSPNLLLVSSPPDKSKAFRSPSTAKRARNRTRKADFAYADRLLAKLSA